MPKKNLFQFRSKTFYFFVLVARGYFTNPALWSSNILMPILIYSIIAFLVTQNYLRVGLAPGTAMNAVMSVSIISFGVSFFEWRKSIFYKKIKTSFMASLQFFFAFALFYSLVSFFIFWFLMSYTLLYDKILGIDIVLVQLQSIPAVNWLWLILGILELTTIGLLMGYIFSFIPQASGVQGMGLLFYMLASFTTGCSLPLFLLGDAEGLVKVTGALPVYPAIHTVQAAMLENYDVIDDPTCSILMTGCEPEQYFIDGQPLKWMKVETDGYKIWNKWDLSVPNSPTAQYSLFSAYGNYWTHSAGALGWMVFLGGCGYFLNRK